MRFASVGGQCGAKARVAVASRVMGAGGLAVASIWVWVEVVLVAALCRRVWSVSRSPAPHSRLLRRRLGPAVGFRCLSVFFRAWDGGSHFQAIGPSPARHDIVCMCVYVLCAYRPPAIGSPPSVGSPPTFGPPPTFGSPPALGSPPAMGSPPNGGGGQPSQSGWLHQGATVESRRSDVAQTHVAQPKGRSRMGFCFHWWC